MKANAAIKAKKADREKRKEEVRAELEAKYRSHEPQPSEQETVAPASPPAASSTGFGGIMGKVGSDQCRPWTSHSHTVRARTHMWTKTNIYSLLHG